MQQWVCHHWWRDLQCTHIPTTNSTVGDTRTYYQQHSGWLKINSESDDLKIALEPTWDALIFPGTTCYLPTSESHQFHSFMPLNNPRAICYWPSPYSHPTLYTYSLTITAKCHLQTQRDIFLPTSFCLQLHSCLPVAVSIVQWCSLIATVCVLSPKLDATC